MNHTFTKPTVTRTGLFLTLLLLAITTVDANAATMMCTATTLILSINFSVRDEAINKTFICPSFHRPVLISEMTDSIGSSSVAAEKMADETSTWNYFSMDIFSRLNKKLGGTYIINIDRKERNKGINKNNPTTHASLLLIEKDRMANSTADETSTCTITVLHYDSAILRSKPTTDTCSTTCTNRFTDARNEMRGGTLFWQQNNINIDSPIIPAVFILHIKRGSTASSIFTDSEIVDDISTLTIAMLHYDSSIVLSEPATAGTRPKVPTTPFYIAKVLFVALAVVATAFVFNLMRKKLLKIEALRTFPNSRFLKVGLKAASQWCQTVLSGWIWSSEEKKIICTKKVLPKTSFRSGRSMVAMLVGCWCLLIRTVDGTLSSTSTDRLLLSRRARRLSTQAPVYIIRQGGKCGDTTGDGEALLMSAEECKKAGKTILPKSYNKLTKLDLTIYSGSNGDVPGCYINKKYN